MSASLRVVATPARAAATTRAQSSTATTVGCPSLPAMLLPSRSRSSSRRSAAGALIAGMSLSSRRLAHSPITRAVRADAPTETLDSATVDAISSVTAAANEAHAAALARAKEEAASWAPAAAADASSLRAKVLNSVADVQQGLLEREVEVRIEFFFLSTMSGERERERERGDAGRERGERARERKRARHQANVLVFVVVVDLERREIRFFQPHPLSSSSSSFPSPLARGMRGRRRQRDRECHNKKALSSFSCLLAVACERELFLHQRLKPEKKIEKKPEKQKNKNRSASCSLPRSPGSTSSSWVRPEQRNPSSLAAWRSWSAGRTSRGC